VNGFDFVPYLYSLGGKRLAGDVAGGRPACSLTVYSPLARLAMQKILTTEVGEIHFPSN
jgi:hypothetical protein